MPSGAVRAGSFRLDRSARSQCGRRREERTFTLIGNPKLVFRLVWRGSIAGIDCVRGVALNEISDPEARNRHLFRRGRLVDPQSKRPFASLHAIHHAATATRSSASSRGRRSWSAIRIGVGSSDDRAWVRSSVGPLARLRGLQTGGDFDEH